MSFDARLLVKPVVALGILVLIFMQTRDAVRRSGVWSRPATAHPAGDPFGQLDRDLLRMGGGSTALTRDPMAFGGAMAAPRGYQRPRRDVGQAKTPVSVPVLTAIIWDADPTASIRLAGHDYTVRVNSLFADYQVTSISREQVVLAHAGESMVLKLQSKGEPQ